MSEFVYLGIQIYLRSFSRWGQKKIWVNENDAKSFFARQSVCWLSSVFCEKRRISSLLTVTMERQKSTYHASKWISQLCLSLLTDDLKCTATRRRKKERLSHVACEFNNSLAVCEQRNNDAMEFSFDKQPVMGERSHSRARTVPHTEKILIMIRWHVNIFLDCFFFFLSMMLTPAHTRWFDYNNR